MQLGALLARVMGGADQGVVVLLASQRSGIDGKGSARGDAELPANVEGRRRGLAHNIDVDAVMDHVDGVAGNVVIDQDALHRLGNSDDAVGPSPRGKAPDTELDATGRHDVPAEGDCCDERQRMAVVRVNHVRLERCDRAPQVPPGARIEADLPGGAVHRDAARGGPLGELAPLFGDERLLQLSLAAELPTQQPDLILAAAPIPARVYLQDSHPSRPSLRRDFHDSGEYAAQGIEFEGLLQEWTAQLFEELQRVAADRVARGEDDAIGDGGVHARERVKHLAPAQPGHTQIADDQIEWLHQGALQRLTPVVGQHHLVTPAFERRLHVVKNVRLVVNNEYPEALVPFGRSRFGLGTLRQRASLRAYTGRQFDRERRPAAAARTSRIHRDVAAVFLDDAKGNGQPEAGTLALGFRAEERLEHALRHGLRYARSVVRDVDGQSVGLALGSDFASSAALPGTRAGDRLSRVVDDVHEHLLDLIRVHLDFGQPRFEGQRELDAGREQLVLQELMRGLENRPDRLQLALALLAPRERQQVAHDRRGALGFLPNHCERLSQAWRHVCGLAEQVAEADHRGEGVVQVVRHACNQLADRRHLLRLQQLFLQAALFGLILEQEHSRARLA